MANFCPKVSVVMVVYNGEKYIYDSIESVLNQTYKNFELLIINDGSTDNTVSIIESFQDIRIRLIHNEENKQQVYSRNRAIELAKGEYIAVNDADDLSMPTRLEKQVEILDNEPDIAIVGSWVRIVDENADKIHDWKLPIEPEHINWALCFYVPVTHSAMMYRKEVVQQLGGYGTEETFAEDYQLFIKIVKTAYMKNIPEVLQYTRTHNRRVTLSYKSKCRENSYRISKDYIHNLIGEDIDENIIAFLRRWGYTDLSLKASCKVLILYFKIFKHFYCKLEFRQFLPILADSIIRFLIMITLRLVYIISPKIVEELNCSQKLQNIKSGKIFNIISIFYNKPNPSNNSLKKIS